MPTPRAPKHGAHTWAFKPRFRRHAFGWRSQPAVQRVKQALAEIKKVARAQPALAAEGAVTFIERISPAVAHVDSSSGAIGSAVNHALAELAPLIAAAEVDAKTRAAWLDRLFDALQEDRMPYIEALGDHWGDLCASREVAAEWAEKLLSRTRTELTPDPALWGHFHGISACLSALYRAERYPDILELLAGDRIIWSYKRWAVKALAAMGKPTEAIQYAESCRGPWTHEGDLDALCEQILLSTGQVEEAYSRYGVRCPRGGTYLATFRAVARTYPHKAPCDILSDLVRAAPGEEGKWFAAAKEVGLYDEAIALASRTPCDPRTLTRAARDLMDDQPAFSAEAGYLALHWLTLGYGYEITSADVVAAYESTCQAAAKIDKVEVARRRVKRLVEAAPTSFVAQILGRRLGA